MQKKKMVICCKKNVIHVINIVMCPLNWFEFITCTWKCCLDLQTPLPKVLDEDEMDEEEEPIDEENYSTTLIDYVTVNLVSMQEIEKLKKQNP